MAVRRLLAALLFAIVAHPWQVAAAKTVVHMVLDDLGFHDLGFTGSLIRTPNLDRLRAQGLLLTNYYVTPICTPSRGALLTGRYPLALGLQGGMTIQPQQTWGLNLNETTLADVLSARGVETHAIGKWHEGSSSWRQTPTFRGFSSFFGYLLGAEDYYTHRAGGGYDLRRDVSPRCGEDCSKVEWGANGTYSPFVFAAEASRVIAAHDASKPLYLYLAWQSVHAPIQAPQAYVEPYVGVFTSPLRQIHGGMLAVLDEAVGNVTRSLQAAGLLDDAVILVTTDNGGPVGAAQPCADCNGASNWPLRGGKHSLYEGGVRGTGFVWSRAAYGTTPANRTYAGLAHITDWLPTTLAWMGVAPYSPTPGFDLHGYDLSADLLSAAQGAPTASPRTEVVLNIDPTCDGTAAIKVGDWKLVLGDPGPPWGWDPAVEVGSDGGLVSEGDFGAAAARVGSACSQRWPPTPPVARLWPLTNTSVYLFNISADPREMNDLSAARPDIVATLTARLATWAATAAWPVQNATIDPRGASALWNGTWTPWLP